MEKKSLKMLVFVISLVLLFGGIMTLLVSFAKPESDFKSIIANNDTMRTMDNSTVDSYKTFFKEEDGTKYDGRVWSDKTVYSYDKTNGSVTLDDGLSFINEGKGLTTNFESDFLNVFSVLGSSQSKSYQVAKNLVIAIDNSSSMYNNVEEDGRWKDTRMAKTIAAINKTIDSLMKENAKNEVAVVLFGSESSDPKEVLISPNTAQTIIPMGHYDLNGENILTAGWSSGTATKPKHGVRGSESGGWIYVNKSLLNKGEEGYVAYKDGTSNMQAGLYQGFSELLSSNHKSDLIDGTRVNRVPYMVVLTDGVATDMLAGDWYNPKGSSGNLENMGFLNNHQNKLVSFVGTYGDKTSWNQFVEKYEQDGYKYRLIAYDDNTGADKEPTNEESIKRLKELASDYESSEGYMLLSTLLTAGYMKEAVNKAYNQESNIFTVSVDMPDATTISPNTENGDISTNGPMMNPKNCFNTEWISKFTANDTDNDGTYYDKDSVGASAVLGVIDALNAYSDLKNNNTNSSYLNKLSIYRPESGASDLGLPNKSNREKYILGYKGTPSHSKFWIVSPRVNVAIKPLPTNNPYNIKMSDVDVNYVTNAYYANSSTTATNSLENIFDGIIKDVTKTAFVPVEGVNASGNHNAISYVDPIGNYLEVKELKKLQLFGKEYTIIPSNKETESQDNHTVTKQYYKVVNQDLEDEVITNLSYKDTIQSKKLNVNFKLSDIKIWVEQMGDSVKKSSDTILNSEFEQSLNVTIPNIALPVRLNSLKIRNDGTIEEFTNNYDTISGIPLRIIYTVGLADYLIDENGKINLKDVSSDYIDKNLKVINNKEYVKFYSNYYTNEKYNNINNTIGNVNVTFSPSNDDLFYIFDENLTIYKTSTGGNSGEGELKETGGKVVLSNAVTNLSEITKDETYYLIEKYYIPTYTSSGRAIWVAKAVKGSNLLGSITYYNTSTYQEVNSPGENVVVATKYGSKKVLDLSEYIIAKEENVTNTATLRYAPSYGSNSTDENQIIVNYLGNNGELDVLCKGSLEIKKRVLGDKADINKTWTFKIVLTPKEGVTFDSSYPYKGGSFIDGVESPSDGTLKFTKENNSYVATIKLKHGQSIKINDIFYGTSYQVIEQEANQGNYITDVDNPQGEIKQETVVTFDNMIGLTTKGTLEIKKEVLGDQGESNRDWNFKIILYPKDGTAIEKSYPYTGSTFIDGVEVPESGKIDFTLLENGSYQGTIKLKHGQAITIKNIEVGTSYKVIEEDSNIDNYNTTSTNETGIIDRHALVLYTNTRGEGNLEYGTLELRKEVLGKNSDKNKEWNFTITLKPKDGTLSNSYTYTGNSFIDGVTKPSDGTIKFTKQNDGTYVGNIKLKHGQSITIKDIELETTYQISEEKSNDYAIRATNEKGIINNHVLASFENTKVITLPKTGELGPMLPTILGTIFIAFGTFIFVCVNKKKKKVLKID